MGSCSERTRNARYALWGQMVGTLAVAAAIVSMGCLYLAGKQVTPTQSSRLVQFPRTMLWAWERPEDLSFIDPRKVGVAFLAKTLRLQGEQLLVRPRMQPLKVPPGTMLMAVVRIETSFRGAIDIAPEQQARLVSEIVGLTQLRSVAAVQVDFDTRESQRPWYHALLSELRTQLPDAIALSITALASWCLYDDWMADLPVDEAVPMLFRMGPEGQGIRRYFASGGDVHSTLCRHSVGLATDEALVRLPTERRRYIFHPQPWSATVAATLVTQGGT